MVWSPHYGIHVNCPEAVKRRFIKFLSFKLVGLYSSIGLFHTKLRWHSFASLDKRREYHSVVFLHKLIWNEMDDINLVYKLRFCVLSLFARCKFTFYLPCAPTNVFLCSPLYEAYSKTKVR